MIKGAAVRCQEYRSVLLVQLPVRSVLGGKGEHELDELIASVGVDVGCVTGGRISHEEWVSVVQKDVVLQEVMGYCRQGWPNRGGASCDAEYFRQVGVELCMMNGVVFRGELLVVPTVLQERVLKLAHEEKKAGQIGVLVARP
ncbi:hypothetical protein NDU88_001837 [Pleurodeles waltl]|uniref:Uncharacterized protein n=1 Tax=Pleurodeles waltl TaxID=8319 RepID=A0AAV7WNA6_PLEWA|nr:hypothetical protein NDU88_001837 [Pleurodeles waltl]